MRAKSNIGIIGYGYVGKAMFKLFNGHYSVRVCDPLYPHLSYSATIEEINKTCALAIICTPTPPKDSGECDTSIVEAVLDKLRTPMALLKSTVAIGTCDRLARKFGGLFVFSPEYCGESSYWTPYAFHEEVVETPFFIFAGPQEGTSKAIDYFIPVCGPTKRYIQTTNYRAAEMAKYMENSFYAMKIAACYEFAEIARVLGVDWNEVRELWLADPRLNPMHTAVFSGNTLPFSGKCLPKDISGLVYAAQQAGYNPELFQQTILSNSRLGKIRGARLKHED